MEKQMAEQTVVYQLQRSFRGIRVSCNYLGVGDADDTFYETILLCGLEDRHTVLSILLHSLGTTIRPVLVAHLLW